MQNFTMLNYLTVLLWANVVFCVLWDIQSGPDNLSMNIAIVEYHPFVQEGLTPYEILYENTNNFIQIIKDLSLLNNIDLIVFPEGALDNVQNSNDLRLYATKINTNEIPCRDLNKYPKFLHRLSCAAIKYNVQILFNLIEKYEDNFFTSDVVLNKIGALQYNMRREHRIGVSFLNSDPIPFAVPMYEVVYHVYPLNEVFSWVVKFTPTSVVTGFSFSFEKIITLKEFRYYLVCSNWISQLPFLTSLQTYQMWAHEFQVSIIFSGNNNPKTGQGGTGIFDQRKPVLLDIDASGATKSYVYNIKVTADNHLESSLENKSVDELSSEMDSFYLEKDPDLYRYKSKVLNHYSNYSSFEVCYNKTKGNYFCCLFSVNISYDESLASNLHYTYHFVAYKGYKTYYNIFEPGGVEVCAIIACLNRSLASCGKRFPKYENIEWPLTFENIIIQAKFGVPRKENIYFSSQFPNSLLSNIKPIHPDFTNWSGEIVTDKHNNSKFLRTFALIQPESRILTFGIFGRNFTLIDPRSSGYRQKSLCVWIISILALFLV